MSRPLCLTAAHVAQVPPYLGPAQPFDSVGEVASDADLHAIMTGLLAKAPPEIWIFAYGSLIWNPGFAPTEDRLARLTGWHRKFCLGWITIYRGCLDRPGLMLALDRGGSCRGVALRVNPATTQADLMAILRREMPLRRAAYAPRWSRVDTDQGPVTALIFPIDRQTEFYVTPVTETQLVTSLSTAAGDHGTMADYLLQTVTHLQDRGLHDGYLWRLQRAVARQIETDAKARSPQARKPATPKPTPLAVGHARLTDSQPDTKPSLTPS